MPATKSKAKAKKVTRTTAARTSLYSVHPGVQGVQDWIASLEAKTGRTLEEWIERIQVRAPKDEQARRAWLKEKHGLGTNTAGWLAGRASNDSGTWDDDPKTYLKQAEDYVEAMFAGKKAGLRPLYAKLLALGRATGADVKFCPCKTIVPFYRHHVIAQVKPTPTRLEFGLALKGAKIPKKSRLIDTGGAAKKDRITHRFELNLPAEVDDEVRRWLAVAYDLDRSQPAPPLRRTPARQTRPRAR